MQYIYRSLYLPEEGMFCQLPEDLGFGELVQVRSSVLSPKAWTKDFTLCT